MSKKHGREEDKDNGSKLKTHLRYICARLEQTCTQQRKKKMNTGTKNFLGPIKLSSQTASVFRKSAHMYALGVQSAFEYMYTLNTYRQQTCFQVAPNEGNDAPCILIL
jgi:hypothetical protein